MNMESSLRAFLAVDVRRAWGTRTDQTARIKPAAQLGQIHASGLD